MTWSAESPSNIALIKYMGKEEKNKESYKKLPGGLNSLIPLSHLSPTDKENLYFKNRSLNTSLSYTLNHFITKVQIEESKEESLAPFESSPFENQKLYEWNKEPRLENTIPPQAQKRFLDFFKFLKRLFQIEGTYRIFSENNFPTGAGAASSASSFSALTKACLKLAEDRSPLKSHLKAMTEEDKAFLSRVGSGSSCRSFFSPWCLWKEERIESFQSPWSRLYHQLILVDETAKKISSSKAHEHIKTSPLFKGRVGRAEERSRKLFKAFQDKDWEQSFQICFDEFLDLHSLFETSQPSFSYRTAQTKKVLNHIQDFWKENKEGPLVTMDAGANIHLLYRESGREQKEEMKKKLFDYSILSSL